MLLPMSKAQPAAVTDIPGLRRVSFSSSLTNLGVKLTRVLSNDSSSSIEKQKAENNERSISRGREFRSSGRGGAGNIRRSSASATRDIDGPDDFSPTRGREVVVTPKITHSGRGGAGNIRSPSPSKSYIPSDLPTTLPSGTELLHSSGRGGFGNISRSRSRGPEERGRSIGRGGAGNISVGVVGGELLEKEEERVPQQVEGVHSTGRGGIANLTSTPVPPVDSTPRDSRSPPRVFSAGRGGIGNIREASKERGV